MFRTPYWSCNTAIEYVFITIHSNLLFFYPKLQSVNDLERQHWKTLLKMIWIYSANTLGMWVLVIQLNSSC